MTADHAPAPDKNTQKSRVGLILSIILILAIGAIAYLFYPKKEQAATGPGGRPSAFGAFGALPVTVNAAKAEKGDLTLTLETLGNVRAQNTATVRAQVSGILQKIHFTEGAFVRAGDPLAEIDPRPYRVQLLQAEGQLARDEASLHNATRDLARYKEAAEAVTQQQIDAAEAAVAQFRGAVTTDRAAVDNAKLLLEFCNITAPIAGTVGLRQVDAGNLVNTGDASGIVVITQLDPISVIFNVPENDLAAVRAAAAKNPRLPVEAYDRSGTTLLSRGELAAIDNQIDATTGTVRLRANFANTEHKLFPNQFVNVRLHTDLHEGATLVPVVAVQVADKDRFVYVIGEDGTVSRRPVKVGRSDGKRVEILDGVAVGETVVTEGLDRLRAGAKVTFPGATPAGARPEGAPSAAKKTEGKPRGEGRPAAAR